MRLAGHLGTKCPARVTMTGPEWNGCFHHAPDSIDADSIMELTYPVCLRFSKNIKNNKVWLTSTLTP